MLNGFGSGVLSERVVARADRSPFVGACTVTEKVTDDAAANAGVVKVAY